MAKSHTNKAQHTPTLVLPLQIVNNGANIFYLYDSSNGKGAGREIATLTNHMDGIRNAERSEEDDANAAFIVRAVNAHEDMLSLLKMCWRKLHVSEQHKYDTVFMNDLAEAITRAEGK